MTTEKDARTPGQDNVPVTLQNKGDLAEILSADGYDAPAMRGFDARFRDIVDYIVKITHEIWEEHGIGRLYDYYSTNMRVHTSDGDIYTREKVIEATIQSLAAFPNRRLYSDEVIWSGNEVEGYYTSHRLTHEGHNWGYSHYGPPTGKRISYRAIAECAVVEGKIVEEWLARDELLLVSQLGLDAHALARKAAQMESEAGAPSAVLGEVDRLRGQLPPAPAAPGHSEAFNVEAFVRRSLHEIWNWRLLNKVADYYAPGYLCASASGRQLYGVNQFKTYVLSLLAPFPDLAVQVDHFCALQTDEERYRTATRWTMAGTHTGPGVYGEPTGNRMAVIGITHHLLEKGKFVQEWTVFDEFALLKQLYRPK